MTHLKMHLITILGLYLWLAPGCDDSENGDGEPGDDTPTDTGGDTE